MMPPPRRWIGIAATTALALAAVGGVGAALFVWSGLYDVSVTAQHKQPVYRLLETTSRQSIQRHARDVGEPPADRAQRLDRGAACYRDKCLQCHGAAGMAPAEIGLSMQPLPGPLIDAATRWNARELHWIIRHGLKMSGMPAWRYRLSDDDQWAVVAFLETMPTLEPRAQQTLFERQPPGSCAAPVRRPAITTGDPARGRLALQLHACASCHVIPGVSGADVHVGPPLRGVASRRLIAGRLPHTADNLVRWIRDPKSVDPDTAMPTVGVGEQDARDIAAYLATLH
jgi:mono/diheme cytochrome c family protein